MGGGGQKEVWRRRKKKGRRREKDEATKRRELNCGTANSHRGKGHYHDPTVVSREAEKKAESPSPLLCSALLSLYKTQSGEQILLFV